MVQDITEEPRGVDCLIFDARSSRLANELGRRDHVTGTALDLGCDLYTPAVVRRHAPMVQTVLGRSAVAVHRQGHRDSCLEAKTDLSGAEDSEDQTPQMQYTEKKVDVPAEQDQEGLTGAGRAADSGNPRTRLIERAAHVPLVTQTCADHHQSSHRVSTLRGSSMSQL